MDQSKGGQTVNHISDANKMVSDTPRTDAAYAASTGAGIYELFKESQDIERELNAANDKIKRLEEEVQDLKVVNEYAWLKTGKLNERIRRLIKLGLETTRPDGLDKWQEEEEL